MTSFEQSHSAKIADPQEINTFQCRQPTKPTEMPSEPSEPSCAAECLTRQSSRFCFLLIPASEIMPFVSLLLDASVQLNKEIVLGIKNERRRLDGLNVCLLAG